MWVRPFLVAAGMMAWMAPQPSLADTRADKHEHIVLEIFTPEQLRVESTSPRSTRLGMDYLTKLTPHQFTTTTIWTEGPQEFKGVLLRDLLTSFDISSGTIRATAVNEYSVDIPFADAQDGSALIAYERNGRPMTIRDKGPLWIVYPYDSDPRFRSELYYTRSIWQLTGLEVLH